MNQSAQLYSNLKEYFGYSSFRPQQEEIINAILEGQDNLVIMPTGGGKSICYQLPATILQGLTLVVSPLIALMKDQVDALLANGIRAAYFNSSQHAEEQQLIFSEIMNKRIKLLYVAPESLPQLDGLLSGCEISMIAIDEAHCISAWGHDFRPAYTQLSFLKTKFPKTPIVALTATADKATRDDIAKQLNLQNPKLHLSSFDRKNLSLEVRPGNERVKQIIAFIDKHPNDCGIVYCLSRKATETLANKLVNEGYKTEAYHAGLSYDERERVQDNFVNDRIQIVCATVAFGMGIDKSNVRWVIHYNLPKNIEGYYQEIGRAGRDGVESHTLLFYSYADILQLKKFAIDSGNEGVQLAKLDRMQQYAEALSCRRKVLLSYFGEHLKEDCGNCDVCKNPPTIFDGTILAQKVLSTIYRVKGAENLATIIDILRGAQNAYIYQKSYQNLSTYAIGKEASWKDWQQYIIQLMNQGFIEIAFHQKSHLKLTELARGVLFEKQQVNLANIDIAKVEKEKQKVSLQAKPKVNDLFEVLRQLRLRLSKEEGVPAYRIFNDAVLKELARVRPVTDDEFLEVSGVGRKKMLDYGHDFIKEIIAFQKSKKPVKKTPTYKISADLFKNGYSIQEIVQERAITETTIISHLCTAYEKGEKLPLHILVSDKDVEKIRKFYTVVEDNSKLKSYYEYFEGKISYTDIRISLAIISRDLKVN